MLEQLLKEYQTMTLDEIFNEIERLESDDNLDEPAKNTCWQELNRILNCRQNQEDMDRPC